MRTVERAAIFGGLLAISACMPSAQTEDTASEDTCGAGTFAALVGQPEAAAEAIPDPKRIIPSNSAVTMDFRGERTNVDLDEAGLITRIWCG